MARIIQANYDDLERIAVAFQTHAGGATQLIASLERCMDWVHGGGWIGLGADQFSEEMYDLILPAMRRLANALQTGAEATRLIARVLREGEEEAARLFSGVESPTPMGRLQDMVRQGVDALTGGVVGAFGGLAAGKPLPFEIAGPRFENDLRRMFNPADPANTILAQRTFGDGFQSKDGFFHRNVDVKTTLFEEKVRHHSALFQPLRPHENIHVEALSIEHIGKVALEIGKSGAKGAVSHELGLYLARIQAGARGDHWEVAGQGYLGAHMVTESGFMLNRNQQYLYTNVDMFAGARANASGKVSGDYGSLGVSGDVRAGIGLEFDIKVGYDNGRVRVGGALGAALGVGAGAKIETEINVAEIASDVYDFTRDAARSVINFLD